MAYGSSSFLSPSKFIAEHLGKDGGYAQGPERHLMSALLFDGVQAYMNYVTARSTEHRKRYREAYNWVWRQGEDYVFSFDNVCEALGVSSDFLRHGLQAALDECEGEWKKARRNF